MKKEYVYYIPELDLIEIHDTWHIVGYYQPKTYLYFDIILLGEL